jgi:hypothetical protein
MPTIADALDHTRFRELRRDSLLACNYWLAFNLACERGDRPEARHYAEQIAILTRTTLRLVKRLGEAEPDDMLAPQPEKADG